MVLVPLFTVSTDYSKQPHVVKEIWPPGWEKIALGLQWRPQWSRGPIDVRWPTRGGAKAKLYFRDDIKCSHIKYIFSKPMVGFNLPRHNVFSQGV